MSFFPLVGACTPQVELLAQVGENQANDVIAALNDAGVSAVKVSGKDGMASVEVPRDQVARAIDIMHADGLPHVPYESMGDVFKKDGLISSPTEERARMIYALSQELSGTISKIDGVIYASVHVVLPEHAGFGESSNPSSAAVFIKYQDTQDLDEAVPQIRRLVANSIPGLSFDKVSVVLVPSAGTPDVTRVTFDPSSSVLGFKVARESAVPLRIILCVLASSLIAAVASITWLLLRARRVAKSDAGQATS